MRKCIAVLGILLFASCQRPPNPMYDDMPPPEAYLHFKDRVAAQMIDWGIPWSIPCTSTVEENGYTVGVSLAQDQCVKFDPPKRFQGLWRDNFEGSVFCPRPASKCPENDDERPWFDARFPMSPEFERGSGGLYEIEFVGRASSFDGGYGHFGMYRQEIIGDRLVSMKVREAPPDQE